MVVFPLSNMKIFASNSSYELTFNENLSYVDKYINQSSAIIIDRKVYNLYRKYFYKYQKKLIYIDVSEKNKTVQTAMDICGDFLKKRIKRHECVLAIGGGIIQDVVTFSTSIYLRGINWLYIPTTLLAQADSCIGGKSSINFLGFKNILGNFYPPSKILINTNFLKTLPKDQIRSGIGEIIKVHLLSGSSSVEGLKLLLKRYMKDEKVLKQLIKQAIIKKNKILKIDAEDKNVRLKMNYGHSFGHALESAANYSLPHGIAITIGLDMANFFSFKKKLISKKLFLDLKEIINFNLKKKDYVEFNKKTFFQSLKKDKKNKKNKYGLILPVTKGVVKLFYCSINLSNNNIINEYFKKFYY